MGRNPGTAPARIGYLPVVLALVAGLAPWTHAPAAESLVERVGEFAALVPTHAGEPLAGSLIVNPVTRRAYQLREQASATASSLEVRDLDSLNVLSTIRLPSRVAPSAAALQSDPLYAMDQRGGRIFMPRIKATGDQALLGFMVLDERTGAVADQPLPPHLTAMGLKVAGLSYSPIDDRLYLLVRQFPSPADPESNVNQTLASGNTPRVFIMRWNPNTGTEDLGGVTVPGVNVPTVGGGLRFLRSCRNLFPTENAGSHYQLPILRSEFEPAVWVGCANNQGGFQIIRIAWDQLADPAGPEDVFPGPERVRDVFADPGSDRLIARFNASLGESWWVFDGRKRSWVGVIGASKVKDQVGYSAGLDDTTGRLYLHYPGIGLMLADSRRTPVPQALVFPQFEKARNCLPVFLTPCPTRIVADPPTRRFFVRTAPNRWEVFRDQEPVPEPPPQDPDANTKDVDEDPARTDVSFTAVGQGYGARALLVGGSYGIVPPGPGAEDARPLRAILLRTGTACGPRDRELAFGVVEKSELGNSLAAVRAHAAKFDEGTNQDLLAPSRCDLHPDPGPPLSTNPATARLYPGIPKPVADEADRRTREIVGWNAFFAHTECSGDQGRREDTSRAPVESIRVTTNCEQAKPRAEADAGGPAIDTPLVKVGSALSRTRLFREDRRGIVSQTYSLARGITIADLITIEAVETWAEASANGRAKNEARADTATTRFVRRITGVTIRDENGAVVFACEDCSRDLIPVIRQANTALVGRAEVRLPMPDPILVSGTPGGFQAAVQKDRFQAIADNALNNDSSTEVPGLEILSLNDSPELRARQVVQLAGAAATASYGIFLLDSFSDFPFLPDAEPLPTGAEVLSTADEGTTVSESITSPVPSLDPPSIPERVGNAARAVVGSAKLLARNPKEGLLATTVWLTLALPVYAFIRRRSLVRSLGGMGGRRE